MDTRAELDAVMLNELNVCDDREIVYLWPTLKSAYDLAPLVFHAYFIQLFTANPKDVRWLFAQCRAVDKLFMDRAKMKAAETGGSIRLTSQDRAFREEVKKAVVLARYPTVEDIVRGARGGHAEKAAREYLRITRQVPLLVGIA